MCVGGKQGGCIYFRGAGEQRPHFEGDMKTKTYTGDAGKQIFDFRGTGEQANLFQGNMYPPPPRAGLDR